ncbi:hypothetical protein AVDCRST_MAG84-2980 [uncultured Microcoleus sp.]|uniref:Uncharacterized protein n=1 Tax=uncultured Microcoleus sp. TaxID=259945 RepID=A0A6J4MA37_9CYAN|nr:hypothetical protein AVDCRST_MAG84-2980 [uncultured Microcoleus sp.]
MGQETKASRLTRDFRKQPGFCVQSNGGFSGATDEFWCKLGTRSPTVGMATAKNELRTRERRSRGTRSQPNVKILRHFREFVKKN